MLVAFLLDYKDRITSKMQQKPVSKTALLSNARATYYPDGTGGLKLARVQVFSTPKFMPQGWEEVNAKKRAPMQRDEEQRAPEDVARAVRRARRNAFDLIMSNPDLNAFVTYTYSPDSVGDKASYEDCYAKLRSHLSNGVQRDGLKYICVPELTKRGDVHFHAIANADALRLTPARNPNNGRLIKHNGDQVYNLDNWRAGFSTAQIIKQRAETDDAREAVAKYIFKYMGKNFGAKIGGRYMLHGGQLLHPIYVYGDGVEDFTAPDDLARANEYELEIPGGKGTYKEYDFLGVSGNRNIGDSLGK